MSKKIPKLVPSIYPFSPNSILCPVKFFVQHVIDKNTFKNLLHIVNFFDKSFML